MNTFSIMKSPLRKMTVAVAVCSAIIAPSIINMPPAEAVFASDAHLTPEQAKAPVTFKDATGRVTFTVSVNNDGNNFNSFASAKNGFKLGDDGPNDGVVAKDGVIGYRISYNVAPSDKPTTVRLKFQPSITNVDGTPTTGITKFKDDSLRNFCAGGSGYQHTGQMQGDVCVMTFLPSSASSTTDAGVVNMNLEGIMGGLVYMSLVTVDNNAKYTLPNPTRIVGSAGYDVMLRRNTVDNAKFVMVDGKGYFRQDYGIELAAINGVGARRAKAHVVGNIDLGKLPEGTKVNVNSPQLKVSGDNTSIAFDYEESPYDLGYPNYSRVRGNRTFSVLVPVEALSNGGIDQDFHISDVKTRFAKPLAYGENDSSLMNEGYGGWLSDPDTDPGLNKDKYADLSTPAIWVPGNEDYKNNDWTRLKIDPVPSGQWYKDLVKDNNGSPSGGKFIEGSPWNSVDNRNPVGTKFWASMGADTFPGSYVGAKFCDVWDNSRQKIDTSRQPVVKVWDSSIGDYRDAKYHVEYSTVDDPNKNLAKGANYKVQQEACSETGSTLTWTSTPSDSSNISRIIFDEAVNGAVDVNHEYTAGRRPALVANLPFVSRSKEELPNYPMPMDLNDTAVFQSGGAWRGTKDTPLTWVSGTTVDIATLELNNYSQNAGSSDLVRVGSVLGNIYNTDDSFDAFKPKVKLTIDSAYSNIDFNESRLNALGKVLDIKRADFGPDKLPGTDDDVSDWEITIEANKEVKPEPNADGARTSYSSDNWYGSISGTLPGYLKAGTQLNVTSELLNPPNDLGDEKANNLRKAVVTVGSKATVSQSKWALNTREMAGTDIGWGIAWSNNSETKQGPYDDVDVLPYNGDGRGTNISAPINNVRINKTNVDDDVEILVTDADPKTITKDSIASGKIKWYKLGEQPGEVTAIRIKENSIDPGQTHSIEVLASTSGMDEGDRIVNNLNEGKVDSLELPLPQTVPVTTVLYRTLISGTVFYDSNNDGKLDDVEKKRIPGVEVTLKNENGEIVEKTVSDESGNYKFSDIPVGKYVVEVTDKGGNVLTYWVDTTGTSKNSELTPTQPKSVNNNFGYHGDRKSSIKVDKRVQGVEENSQVESNIERTFEFVVTNDGETPLKAGAKLNDDVLGPIDCDVPALNPGESHTCVVKAPISKTE